MRVNILDAEVRNETWFELIVDVVIAGETWHVKFPVAMGPKIGVLTTEIEYKAGETPPLRLADEWMQFPPLVTDALARAWLRLRCGAVPVIEEGEHHDA